MPDSLDDREMEVYARQIVLSDIGYEGQLKLRDAAACIVGLGGLGSPSALKLAGMGIGRLRLVDRDIVSRSDLHRQHLYDTTCLGQPKVEAAAQRLRLLNPDVELEPVPEALRPGNAESIIAGADIVIDGLDRPEPRYAVNRACLRLGIPYLFGAAVETFGNASTILPGQSACLECFMGGLTNADLPVCGNVGVHPSILGVISAMQVAEAVRILTGAEPKLSDKLLYVDLRELEFMVMGLRADEKCPVCGSRPEGPPRELQERFFEETCAQDGRRTVILTPMERVELDLDAVGDLLRGKGAVIRSAGSFGLSWAPTDDRLCFLLRSGIMITRIAAGPRVDIREGTLELYRSLLIDGLGLSPSIVPG